MKPAAAIVDRLLETDDDDLAGFDAKADAIEHAPPPFEYWEIYVGEITDDETKPDGYSVFLQLPSFSTMKEGKVSVLGSSVVRKVIDMAIDYGDLDADDASDIAYVTKISEKDYHDATLGRQTVG